MLPGHSDFRPPSIPNVEFRQYPYVAVGGPSFGFGSSLHADTKLTPAALMASGTAVPSLAFQTRSAIRSFDPDVIHAHWLVPGGLIAPLVAGSVPVVISEHGSGAFLARKYKRTLGRVVARAVGRASAVTACSDPLARSVADLGVDLPVVIAYGVAVPDAVDRSRSRLAFGIHRDVVLIVAVGRLVSKKGFEFLIEAAAPLGDVQVLIAGDGDLDGSLQAMIEKLDAPVELIGRLGRQQVSDLLAAADITVVPSVVDEAGNVDGLPNVLLEAMAHATPVIASNVAGIPMVLTDGENGRLVPPGDAAALRAMLRELIDDPSQRRSLGLAAQATVRSQYSWERCVEQYSEVLTAAAR